jgi:putative nucleotidyltransferase with HDIG domain
VRFAQRRLGRTIRRARLVEDRALARTVRELGERLAHINHGLLQLVKIHDVSNAALDHPVAEFRHVLESLIELLGPVSLVCVEDHVYVNDIRIRFDLHQDHARALEQMFRRHNVGGLTYFQGLTDEQTRTTLSLFTSNPASDRPRRTLQGQLDTSGLSCIELQPTFRFLNDEQRLERGLTDVFEALIGVAAEAFANVAANRIPNPLPVRRTLNDLLDVTQGRDLARIAFEADATALPFAQHALMVTNLSVLIARSAGLPDASISDLAVSALLHDIGYCTENGHDKIAFQRHTSVGARAMLRQRGFHEARVRRLLVMLQHHQPHNSGPQRPSLHARIVHIADDYDTLTRHRNSQGPVCVPSDALRMMAANPGYDSTLLQLFINSMGQYPPGSVLRLGDGTMVVSLSGVRSPETFDKPRSKVVRMANGEPPQQELWVDLAKGGRIEEVLGSRLYQQEPEPEPERPSKPSPPLPRPTFGSTNLRMPKPFKPKGNGDG